jgi:hypothetical protein
MRFHRYLACLLLPVLLLGCGKAGPKVAPVSGRVTMDNKPLANADITFSPTESDPNNSANLESFGQTDEDGRYSLKMIQGKRDGAVVGANKVRISLIERGGKLVNRVPAAYNKSTSLTYTVPAGGSTEANFDLSSKGPR